MQYTIQKINKLRGKYYYYRDSESDRIAQLKSRPAGFYIELVLADINRCNMSLKKDQTLYIGIAA